MSLMIAFPRDIHSIQSEYEKNVWQFSRIPQDFSGQHRKADRMMFPAISLW